MASVHLYDGDELRAVPSPEAARRLRWAAWRPGGEYALLVGNRGQVLRFDGRRFDEIPSASKHNLRGAAWSPDGALALLAGNRGALLLYDGVRFEELPAVTQENLRRAAWAPDGRSALIIGNGGVVLRFDRDLRGVVPLPGDRAHTMRSIAWRPDGAYALIGAYASAYAGYPPPHALYRCDGRYTQALLSTDYHDDAVAIDWRPGAQPPRALIITVAYRDDGTVANKLLEYDGSSFAATAIEAPVALLGASWRGDGAQALICGERGALFRYDGRSLEAVVSSTADNLVGPFWRPGDTMALFLKGPDEKVYTV